jgi:hypothetical protein
LTSIPSLSSIDSQAVLNVLTIFTAPKPFIGHTGIIQKNAIRSWKQAAPNCQILLFGDEDGTEQAAHELDVGHISEIHRSPHGAPLLDFIFQQATTVSEFSTLCFANADIIFKGNLDFLTTLPTPFLCVGESMDLLVPDSIDFSNPNWRNLLSQGTSRGPFALDYFFFSKDLYRDIPPFRIGRARYDNWMVWHALQKNTKVIDVTQILQPIHQNHDYAHLAGGRNEAYRGTDALFNQKLAGLGCYLYLYSVNDARWSLTPAGLLPNPSSFRFSKQLLRRLNGWISERSPKTKSTTPKDTDLPKSDTNSAQQI